MRGKEAIKKTIPNILVHVHVHNVANIVSDYIAEQLAKGHFLLLFTPRNTRLPGASGAQYLQRRDTAGLFQRSNRSVPAVLISTNEPNNKTQLSS